MKAKNLYIWSIFIFFLESEHIFTLEMIDKTFDIQKVFYTIVQSYFLVVFVIFGNLFQSEMDIIQKV